MTTAVHIEDEPRNIELVQSLLENYCSESISLIGNATNLPDAFDLIKIKKPQLVYLDIELNQGSAFELLEQIQHGYGIDFEIIFITAFNDYAIKAFRQNAVDYILKPISTSELIEATANAVQKINNSFNHKNITDLLRQINQTTTIAKVGLPVNEGLHFVNTDDIIKAEAKGSNCLIYLINNKKLTCTRPLKDLETILAESKFIRVHNTWVINRVHLKKYYKGKNSYMEMEDGSTVPVSVRKKGDFLDMF